ncbi:MAG: helicase SNF2, partial [Candidatus Riflebacteria bacterium]|nr:helicase SNF2 [Candidatus Riflebacteria bacterium]
DPCSEHSMFIHRSHPLVSLLADYILENALGNTQKKTARTAVTLTQNVSVVTTVFLLRLRHQLSYKRKGKIKVIMAEEMVSVAVTGRSTPKWEYGEVCNKYLEAQPSGNPSQNVITKELQEAASLFINNKEVIDNFAKQRAEALLADHRRVREAAADRGSYEVKPCLPVDLIGIYVLLPDEL